MVADFPDAQPAVIESAGFFSHEKRPTEVANAPLKVLAATR